MLLNFEVGVMNSQLVDANYKKIVQACETSTRAPCSVKNL